MDNKTISFEDAQKMLDQNNGKSIFEALADSFQTMNPDLGDMKDLGALLALEDDQFAMLSPIFLDSLERTFTNAGDRITIAAMLNAKGVKVAEIQANYDELMTALSNEFKDVMSQPKIDFLKAIITMVYNAINETEGVSKKIINIPIQLLNNAKLPAYANLTDSGMDVYALEDITINPGETVLVPTGLKVALPRGYEIQVRPKSGRCLKTKLRIANTPGTIDAGYRDEIGVIIDNIDPPIKKFIGTSEDGQPIFEYGTAYTIGKGEKFAQLVLCEVIKANLTEVSDISIYKNDGRNGGFGSTGLK